MAEIRKLSDKEFSRFWLWLPIRVRMLVKAGLTSNWEKILEDWYKVYKKELWQKKEDQQ